MGLSGVGEGVVDGTDMMTGVRVARTEVFRTWPAALFSG